MSTGLEQEPRVVLEPTLPLDDVHAAQLRRMNLESLVLTACYGLTALVGVAFWAVAARTIPIEQLGLNTAVLSAFTAAAVVGATGVANAFLSMVPIAGRAQGQLLRHGYLIVVSACLVTGVVAGVIAALAVPKIGDPLWTVLAITAASCIWGVFAIQDSVLVALGKPRWLLAENIPVSLIKLASLPILASAFGERSHPAVIATVAPAALAVMVVSGVVIPRLVRAGQDDTDRPLADAEPASVEQWMAEHRREFQLFAVRDGVASALNLGLFMFLPFLVTASAGEVQGAVFALALQISNAMDLFTAGVGISLTTTVASDHGSGPAIARVMWKRLVRIVGAVAVLVIAGAPVLLWVFGPKYLHHNGWWVVVILVTGALLRTTFEVWTALLRALRRTGTLLAWTSLTSATLLAGILVGAHLGGAVGASIGVAVAAALSSVIGVLGLLERLGTVHRADAHRGAGPVDTRIAWPWLGLDPAPMEGVREVATWFGSEDRPRFGWLSVPDSGEATQAVILCPPVGEEARSSHRAIRRLGSELARRGVVAMRVDYDGVGDSAGGQHDPERVAAWKASIRDAGDHLRTMGLGRVGVVGMRIGATLGAEVAAEGGFDSVVLWDPCSTGRSFLREGMALHALGEHTEAAPTDGSIHTPGFAYDKATVDDLRSVSLASLPVEPWCERLLVLTRSGRAPAGAAGRSLTGDHIEWAVAAGQLELIGVEPNQARTPVPTVEHIADWVAAGATEPVPFVVQARTEAVFHDSRSGARIRERIVALGPNKLFGIVTEPLNPGPHTPWIAMVNVAIEIHIGPGRRWVDFARSWAALGLRCVRFDQSGLGDSPRRPEQREDTMFDRYWLEDVPDVIDALDAGSAPVSAFGLCSGAYSAFEAGMRRKLDAIYAVSIRITVPEMAPGEPAYSPDRIAARPFVRPLARLFQHNTRAAWGLWRLYQQVAAWRAPMSSVKALLATGTTVRILADRKDAETFREVIWWSFVRRRSIKRTGRYDIRTLANLDHALMGQRSQDITYDDATRFWLNRYGVESTAGESASLAPGSYAAHR